MNLNSMPSPTGIAKVSSGSLSNPFGCFESHVYGDPLPEERTTTTSSVNLMEGEQTKFEAETKDSVASTRKVYPVGGYVDIKSVDELPDSWWVEAPNLKGGYQYESECQILDKKVPLLLDGCAGCKSCSEELIAAMITYALNNGVLPNDKRFQIAQLEKWPLQECVQGLAKSSPVDLKGGAVLRVALVDMSGQKSKSILVRVKICAVGTVGFNGLILGGRALDCVERGGLGHVTSRKAHVLSSIGIYLPRKEKTEEFVDGCYMMRDMVKVMSAFDGASCSSSSFCEKVKEEELLRYSGPGVSVEPGEGVWVPVERAKGAESSSSSNPFACEVVMPVGAAASQNFLEVAPGIWETSADVGFVFVTNPTTENDALEAVVLSKGDAVAVVEESLAVQQFCEECGTTAAFCLCFSGQREMSSVW